MSAAPTQQQPQRQDDGFNDFQGAQPSGQAQKPNEQQLIQNIMSMYSQLPHANPSNTKYAPLEVMPDFSKQQQ